MDWSKSKNILIIAFIITNLFLAYVLFMTEKDKYEIVVEDQLVIDVVKLLEKENIKIDTEIPRTSPNIPIISLEYEVYEPKKIVEKFLGNYKEEYIKEEKIYTNQQKNVAFEDNNKRIIYTDESLQNKSDNKKISKKEALEKSEEFIVSHGFSLKDASLSFYSQKDEIHKIEYIKIINGIITEETNMQLEVSSEGVISFERYWVKGIKRGTVSMVASSAPKALLRLLTREEYYGKTIKQIDICYYFNADKYKKNIEFNNSTGGLATPAWRFIFEDGDKAFLEES